MRTRRRPTPPTDANELLAALRAGRLISPQRIRQLAVDWSESRPDEPDDPVDGTRRRALELVEAGCLTSWQVEQVLSGRARRLRMGHYRLLEWLGAGGMGSVYKAEHRLMKRVTARGNDFFLRDGLLACAGYADRQVWRQATRWEDRDNRCHGSGTWLNFNGRPTEVNSLAAWRHLWRDAEPGSQADGERRSRPPLAKLSTD